MNNYLNPCPANSMPYIVRAGDTLNSVSDRYGISLKELIDLNPDLRLRSLVVGMQICVPKVNVRPACPNGNYYTIKKDDSFYKVAKKYNISLNKLMLANPGINPYNLQIGQEICIPIKNTNCPFGTVYTIESGDNLGQVLIKYNISLNELKKANPDWDPKDFMPDTKLCIPPAMSEDKKCPTNKTYIIKEGDTLSSISENCSVTATEMLIANPDMKPVDFTIAGVKICVPAQKVTI